MVDDAAAPGDAAAAEAGSGPVLALLSRGLEFWVRQQCQAIDSLEIRLEGTALQLLRGRLEGVRVQARGVRYQDLELAEVRLRSDALRVRMGALVRRQVLELENPFQVVGSIVFSSDGLNRSLAHPNWSWLGDDLAEGLLGIRPLAGLRLEEDRLVLRALPSGPGNAPVERATLVGGGGNGGAPQRERGGGIAPADGSGDPCGDGLAGVGIAGAGGPGDGATLRGGIGASPSGLRPGKSIAQTWTIRCWLPE